LIYRFKRNLLFFAENNKVESSNFSRHLCNSELKIFIVPVPLLFLFFEYQNLRLSKLALPLRYSQLFSLLFDELKLQFKQQPLRTILNLLYIHVMPIPNDIEFQNLNLIGLDLKLNVCLQPSLHLMDNETYSYHFPDAPTRVLWFYSPDQCAFQPPKLEDFLKKNLIKLKQTFNSTHSAIKLNTICEALLINYKFCTDKSEKYYPTTLYEDTDHHGFPFEGIQHIQGNFYRMKCKEIGEVTQAIHLGYSHNIANYWHFVSELLPRVLLLKDHFPTGVPFVCPNQTPAPFVQLMETILDSKAVLVDSSQNYAIETLFYIEDFRYRNLPNIFTGDKNMFSQISEDLVSVRNHLLDRSKSQLIDSSVKENARVFISRRNIPGRVFPNEDRILSRLVSEYSFVPIFPENLSILSQVKVFQQAEVVVGAGGSALANLIFCRPGTKVIVQPGTENSNLRRFWRDLALLFSLEFVELKPPSKQTSDRIINYDEHGLFKVLNLSV
jgi:Glycosyltransferase 61